LLCLLYSPPSISCCLFQYYIRSPYVW
jgi:hypothetical protein